MRGRPRVVSTWSSGGSYSRALPALNDIADAARALAVAHAPQIAQAVALALGIGLTIYVVRRRGREAPSVRASLAQDAMHLVVRALVIVPVTAWMFAALDRVSGGRSLGLLDALPGALALVAYVVLVDLFEYGVHRLFHRVPALWRLHAVHHAQPWVSPLTTARSHPVELLTKRALSWLPLLMLGAPRPAWVLWIVVDGFWGFFVHSGLPVTLGPLGRLVVSPRFHALHHARDRAYHDANFGERLALWDVLFGTARFDAPPTLAQGVDDPTFPVERDGSPLAVLRTYAAQCLHPFRAGAGGAGAWRMRAKRLGLVGAGMLVAFFLAEIVLRVAGVSPPAFYDYDDALGWAPIPLADGIQSAEGQAHVRIDAAGFRDHDHAIEAAPGTFRIAALGDSYTDAIQVELEATWWHRLEGELARCPALSGRTIEVMDFGVRGYGTAQELLLYRRTVRAYHPDLTLLLYTPENDLVESTRALSAKGYLAPFFELEDGELVLHPPTDGATFVGIPVRWLLRIAFGMRRHSRVIAMMDVEGLWHLLRDGARARSRFVAEDDPELERTVTYAQSYLSPDEPSVVEAWRVTDALLETLATEVGRDGSSFFLVTGSAPIQVHPDASRRRALAARLGVPDLYASERHVGALADRIGAPHLLLAPELAREVDASGAFLHGFARTGLGIGHWNEAGHEAAARRIAAAVCEELSERETSP